nr:VCBS domain-containing protein [Pelagimonas varians]
MPLNGDGTVQCVSGTAFDDLAVGETAVDTLTYSVLEEYGAISLATISVTVTGTDDAPVARPGFGDVDEDGNWTYELDNTDADPDAQDSGVSAVDSFVFEVNDGNGGNTQTSVDVCVHGQDDIAPAVGISVVDMTGRYQWGFTDCYASSRFGDINNTNQLGEVTTLLNDGYTAASSSSTDFSLVNSVNNYPGPVNTMTLDLEGNGTLVDTVDFVSSRIYSLGTVVEIEALDCGGQWVSIYSGTTCAIGVVSGAA